MSCQLHTTTTVTQNEIFPTTPSKLLGHLSLCPTSPRDVCSAPTTPATKFSAPDYPLSISPLKRPPSQPSTYPHKKSRNDQAVTRTSSRESNVNEHPLEPPSTSISLETPAVHSIDVPEPYAVGRYLYYPQIVVFHIKNEQVERVYHEVLRPKVLEYCIDNFDNFSLGMMYTGYTQDEAVPSVLMISSAITEEHISTVRSIVDNCGTIISTCYFYHGDTVRGVDIESGFQDWMETPSMGASLGLSDSDGSFSLGAYVQLEDDSSPYVVSVHHGISAETTSITPNHVPVITVQQPSKPDFENAIGEWQHRIDCCSEGPLASYPQFRITAENNLKSYEDLQSKLEYGVVAYSELDVIMFEGRSTSSDWSLIKVTTERVGENCIALFGGKHPTEQWPHDKESYFVTKEDRLSLGQQVYKQGRATGRTKGEVSFVRWDCQIPMNDHVTSEYCVARSADQFSSRGDSGSGVMGPYGAFVGHIIGGTDGTKVIVAGQERLGPIHVTYITPWSLTKDRIEKKIGKKLKLRVLDPRRISRDGFSVEPPIEDE